MIICVGILTGYTDTLYKMLTQLTGRVPETTSLLPFMGTYNNILVLYSIFVGLFDQTVHAYNARGHTQILSLYSCYLVVQ